jgi:hypothetical protein
MRDLGMGTRDERVDAYIGKSADFARPILNHLRDTVHTACPEVEETMKWSFPNFMYKGMLCSMAAFKEHCSFGFWKGSLVLNKNGDYTKEGMGHLGRITKLSDLPSKKVLVGYIKEAMKLNDAGVKSPTRSKRKRPKRESSGHLREIQSQPQARVYRMDHRGQDRGHAHAPVGNGDRMDGRGKAEKLEIYELLE